MELMAGVIIKDLRPINLVNGEGCEKLIAYLEPGYKLPSATHFIKLLNTNMKKLS